MGFDHCNLSNLISEATAQHSDQVYRASTRNESRIVKALRRAVSVLTHNGRQCVPR
jgi:hypothetical protein